MKNKTETARQISQSFLGKLKAAQRQHEVWSVRGHVFARVMLCARDAGLSGAEWQVLASIALHLQHLGRSKGFMTIKTLAEDCMRTERTVRNALRALGGCGFVHARIRGDGRLELRLDKRFSPGSPWPVDKSVDNSPRRSAARKKISRSAPQRFPHTPSVVESTYSPQRRNIRRAVRRSESPGHSQRAGNNGPPR